jgi:hypothetical protein
LIPLTQVALGTGVLTYSRWEDLEEQPVEGQWKYFERNSM